LRHTFIAVEGPIGVGKTSLVNSLAGQMDDPLVVLEEIDNPFLADFYQDKAGSAFRTQLYFLLARYEQLRGLSQRELFRRKVVADFTFEKDKIFAYLTLADSELLIYDRLYDLLTRQVPSPDMVVYLTAGVDTLMRRIRGRDRDFEAGIDKTYLREVNRAYNHYFFHYARSPLLVVNTDEIDFVNDPDDLTDLIGQIAAADRGTSYYVPRHG